MSGSQNKTLLGIVSLSLYLFSLHGFAASSGERGLFTEGQNAYEKKEYTSAIKKFVLFEKLFPQSSRYSEVKNLHGLCLLLTNNPDDAIKEFKIALETPDSQPKRIKDFRNYVNYNLASAYYDASDYTHAGKAVEDIDSVKLDTETRAKYFFLRGKLALKQGNPTESVNSVFYSIRLTPVEGEEGAPYLQLLKQALEKIKDIDTLKKIYQEHSASAWAEQIQYQIKLKEKDSGISVASPSPASFTASSAYVHHEHAEIALDTPVVGVLLPLSGKFGKYGQKALQAIELGLKIFSAEAPDLKIKLVTEDSGEEAETALTGLKNLSMIPNLAVVIGPMVSKGADAVANKADELGIPLLVLAPQSSATGDWIFQTGLSSKVQSQSIAKTAIEKMNFRRFAILHPKDKYGEQAAQTFWDTVESLGGTITGIESYSPGETDFRQAIDKLSGLYYTEARQHELEIMAQERETQNIKKRTRKTEQYFALKPLVDYDAVFIPDEAKVAGQILPTFAYRDIDHMNFLGLSTWNSPELIQRAQAHADGALFVDLFSGEFGTTSAVNFFNLYKNAFLSEPAGVEAMAYDAAQFIEKVISEIKKGSVSRAKIAQKLKEIQNFNGVTGKVSYQNGTLTRDLITLAIQNGKIVKKSPEQ